MQHVYIAGPMRGIPNFNFPAFDAARDRLRSEGFAVVSPADMDREERFNPGQDEQVSEDEYRRFLLRDFTALSTCDVIYMLNGWRDSPGALAEKAFAESLKMPVHFEDEKESAAADAGKKNSKPQRFDLMPPDALWALSEVYEAGRRGPDGELKYEDRNWERGYKWGLSFAACQRHLWSFWGGEDRDPESGLPHLAHAAWHCVTLLAFWLRGVGTDDRGGRG